MIENGPALRVFSLLHWQRVFCPARLPPLEIPDFRFAATMLHHQLQKFFVLPMSLKLLPDQKIFLLSFFDNFSFKIALPSSTVFALPSSEPLCLLRHLDVWVAFEILR